MRRNILHIAVILGSVLASGCAKEPAAAPVVTPQGEPTPIFYSMTRALGEPVPPPPTAYTAYTFVSYLLSNASGDRLDPVNYRPNPDSNGKTAGYYAYMPDEDKYKGILQPCKLESNRRFSDRSDPDIPDGRFAPNGQGLYDGHYMSVCIHPAVDLKNNGNNSRRILFIRDDERLVSEPFHIEVNGYEVFDLPEVYVDDTTDPITTVHTVPMADIRSKVWFDIIQGSDRRFSVKEPAVVNAGYWGWYHPLLRRTAISYDKGDYYKQPGSTEFHNSDPTTDNDGADNNPKTGRFNIYEKDVNETAGSYEDISLTAGAAPNDGTGSPNTIHGPVVYADPADGNGKVIYSTGRGIEQGIFFFANDYTLANNTLLQPGLFFKLVMGEAPNEAEFKITVPLNIDMKSNHAYLFRLTVESAVIRVHFRDYDNMGAGINPWEDGYDDDNPIGGTEWKELGMWEVGAWVPHNPNQSDDDKDIG